jgi:hypothetical protein
MIYIRVMHQSRKNLPIFIRYSNFIEKILILGLHCIKVAIILSPLYLGNTIKKKLEQVVMHPLATNDVNFH